MKNFKFSVLALFSVVVMSLTSCLGDGDNTQYVQGIGTANSSNSVLLDNGLTVKTSGIDLSFGKRIILSGGVDGNEYEAAIAKLQESGRASVNMQSLYNINQCVDGEFNLNQDNEMEDADASVVENLSWSPFGSFGNGYMNFSVKADWYIKETEKTSTTIEPSCSLYLTDYDASKKSLDLVFVYDNHADQCTKEDGKVDTEKGYALISGYEIPVSINMSALYSYLRIDKGLTDDTELTLSIRYVKDAKHTISTDTPLSGTFSGKNYFTVGMMKQTVY